MSSLLSCALRSVCVRRWWPVLLVAALTGCATTVAPIDEASIVPVESLDQ